MTEEQQLELFHSAAQLALALLKYTSLPAIIAVFGVLLVVASLLLQFSKIS